MSRAWLGTGPEYAIEWAGAPWTLVVDGDHPGLSAPDRVGPYLGLAGLAEVGRWEPLALSGRSLETAEIRGDRVEATYAPEGWHGIRVRASWWPTGSSGIDLEVQLQASSVGELRLVEVQTMTVTERDARKNWVAVSPRDPTAAATSYDGREPELACLATGLLGRDKGLWRVSAGYPEPPSQTYVEMIRPGDWSRRICEGRRAFRQALFGYDLEKGVVLRAHLRACWVENSKTALKEIDDEFRRFQAEPPALGT